VNPGDLWDFAHARTLPGYPTDTKDVPGLDLCSTDPRKEMIEFLIQRCGQFSSSFHYTRELGFC